MRRVTMMLAAMAVMVPLFAVVAYAAQIDGTLLDDTIKETQRNDQIAGHRGNDEIQAGFYSLGQTPGGLGDTDKVKGNKGDDSINTQDGDGRDTINGGNGIDTCVADAGDEVKNCEK